MRKSILKFRDWFNYVRNRKTYLENEEIKDATVSELNKKIEKLNNKIARLEIYNEVKDNLLEQKDKKILDLKLDIIKISKKIKENK